MLTTVTIISIFTEIFTAGILFSGGVTFLLSYLANRRLRELFFSLIFFSFFVYVSAVLTSQLMFDMGWGVSELIPIQKTVYVSMALCGLFIWLFIVEKFELKKGHYFSLFFTLISLLLVFRVISSSLNLVYREDVVEPIVLFSSYVPVKQFLTFMWLLLAVFSLRRAFIYTEGRRVLLIYSGISALLLLGSFIVSLFYVRFGEVGYLLASWILGLIGIIGLLLGELVPPESPEAKNPLTFIRTRLLFKLMLIFVLLIVILFEVTTLATINISKRALSKYVQTSYLKDAQELASRIDSLGRKPDAAELQKLISLTLDRGETATIFVVNSQGTLVAHPDLKRVLQKENMKTNGAVERLFKSKTEGVAEFRDEMGSAMVGAYIPLKKYDWGIVVEEPLGSAYFDIRRLETNSLLFVMAGIIMTVLAGIFFASSIEKSIRALTRGTEAVSRGELSYNIEVDSADEIGRLANAFNQMTRELRDSQERLILSEKLASLGTMAAGMAHEIKNPLVSLRTFTQLLTQKWEDKEYREKFAAIIPHEIERINKIAESLLKFGRPMKPELVKVDVNTLLEEVILLFENEFKKYNVRVTKKIAELPEIYGDPGQLSQAFVNIVKNGLEAMQEKGGELVVKTDIGEVIKLGKGGKRQAVQKGDEVVWGEEEEHGRPVPVIFIEITDTGEGISEESMKSLFDPFYTTKMSGTGMGLPITLRIIEEHKGSLKVRSRPGKGTTFIITLPQKG